VVPEVEGAEIGAIFRGAVSIHVVDSLVSEMEKRFSGTLMEFKG
jgi:hypothetical protein